MIEKSMASVRIVLKGSDTFIHYFSLDRAEKQSAVAKK